MGKNFVYPLNHNMRVKKTARPSRERAVMLVDGVSSVPSLAGFFRVIEEGSTIAAESASGEELILAESGENLSSSPAEGATFKRERHLCPPSRQYVCSRFF